MSLYEVRKPIRDMFVDKEVKNSVMALKWYFIDMIPGF